MTTVSGTVSELKIVHGQFTLIQQSASCSDFVSHVELLKKSEPHASHVWKTLSDSSILEQAVPDSSSVE